MLEHCGASSERRPCSANLALLLRAILLLLQIMTNGTDFARTVLEEEVAYLVGSVLKQRIIDVRPKGLNTESRPSDVNNAKLFGV